MEVLIGPLTFVFSCGVIILWQHRVAICETICVTLSHVFDDNKIEIKSKNWFTLTQYTCKWLRYMMIDTNYTMDKFEIESMDTVTFHLLVRLINQEAIYQTKYNYLQEQVHILAAVTTVACLVFKVYHQVVIVVQPFTYIVTTIQCNLQWSQTKLQLACQDQHWKFCWQF